MGAAEQFTRLITAVNVLMTLQPQWFGLANAAEAVRWSFVSVGVWWVVFALPCAYALAKLRWRGREASFLFVLLALLVPPQVPAASLLALKNEPT